MTLLLEIARSLKPHQSNFMKSRAQESFLQCQRPCGEALSLLMLQSDTAISEVSLVPHWSSMLFSSDSISLASLSGTPSVISATVVLCPAAMVRRLVGDGALHGSDRASFSSDSTLLGRDSQQLQHAIQRQQHVIQRQQPVIERQRRVARRRRRVA